MTYHAVPDDLARLGFALAHELNREAPGVSDLPEDVRSLARTIAAELKTAQRPLIISGTGCENEAVIHAAADVAMALCEGGKKAGLCYVVPECNTLGAGLLGGGSLEQAMQTVMEGRAEGVIIIENDLYRRVDGRLLDAFFERAKQVMVIDHLMNRTVSRADMVLPAATFAEADGTVVNNEGRAQRFFQVFVPEGDIQETWRWLRDMMAAAGRAEVEKWKGLDDIRNALAEASPVLKPLNDIAPDAGFRISGQKIPRQSHRYSGRTSMTAHIDLHEQKPPGDPDSPLSFSMEGYPGKPPSPLITRFWHPGWNSVQSVNKFQTEIGGGLCGGDPGKRIFEPSQDKKMSYFNVIPPAFVRVKDEYLIILLYHIFGSEELSLHAPGIAERAPVKYIGLNPEDADVMGIRDGEEVEIILPGCSYRLMCRIIASLPEGSAGMPSGLPGLEWFELPATGRVRKLQGPGKG
jgi:NADH-quinone oxidoreductase subunit G